MSADEKFHKIIKDCIDKDLVQYPVIKSALNLTISHAIIFDLFPKYLACYEDSEDGHVQDYYDSMYETVRGVLYDVSLHGYETMINTIVHKVNKYVDEILNDEEKHAALIKELLG